MQNTAKMTILMKLPFKITKMIFFYAYSINNHHFCIIWLPARIVRNCSIDFIKEIGLKCRQLSEFSGFHFFFYFYQATELHVKIQVKIECGNDS